MAQLTLKVNGYAYSVGCDDGQEPHLRAMAEQIESRVAGLKAMGGQSGEARLLLLTALMMADELHDMALERDERRPPPPRPATPVPDKRLAERLNLLAERAEEIAAGLEQPQMISAGLPGSSGK